MRSTKAESSIARLEKARFDYENLMSSNRFPDVSVTLGVPHTPYDGLFSKSAISSKENQFDTRNYVDKNEIIVSLQVFNNLVTEMFNICSE